MCGITLIVSCIPNRSFISDALSRMGAVQSHRGPDDQGTLIEAVSPDIVLGLGNQRLAIQDLSAHGHQPMESPCGRYVIVFNGEIYNFRELAKELGADPILDVSDSDTAVALAALARWGEEAFSRFNGMWALAFFDRQKKRLLISRDRLGVKPLYWYRENGSLYFASEIKSLLTVASRKFDVNEGAVARYLFQSLTDTSAKTFFKGIEAVPAGCYADMTFDRHVPETFHFQAYWRHPYERGVRPEAGYQADPKTLWELLVDSVGLRLRSDVPVGILLSGGLDSSAMLAAAKVYAGSRLTALSVVSDDPHSNEEPYIDLMASHTGCDVVKVHVDANPSMLLDELERVCWFSDEPVGGFSAVAHRLMMEQARANGLTVLLTGQGADEQLGGYNKYLYFYLMDCLRRGRWTKGAATAVQFGLRGTVFREFTFEEARRYLPWFRQRGARDYAGPALEHGTVARTGMADSYAEREYLDVCRYSVPMLLHYEDRMSMSHSREIREPFLDYRIVEYLARVPVEQKLNRGWTKWILRQAIAGRVPEVIRWRKDKKGFNVPEKEWARTHFRDRFMMRFSDNMLAGRLGFVRPAAVRRLYERWLGGDRRVTYKSVFSVYCLEVWLNVFAKHLNLENY